MLENSQNVISIKSIKSFKETLLKLFDEVRVKIIKEMKEKMVP